MATEASTAHHDDHGHHGPAFLAHHFESPLQQFDAAKLGMWLFLAQEILFFSGLFVAYGIFRTWYPEAWSVGSHTLSWKLGTLNTCVLLISSFTAAQAVRHAQLGERGKVQSYLIVTFVCAAAFMVIKYFEYTHKFHVGFFPGQYFNPTTEGYEEIARAIGASHYGTGELPYHIRSYFGLYFVMTGLHGVHVLIGMGLIVWMLIRNARGEFTKDFWTPIDIFALYWHLVDLVWIFLFPLMYLID